MTEINVNDRAALYEAMAQEQGTTFDYVIATKDPRPDVTISADAMELVGDVAKLWLGSRAMQRLDKKRDAKRVRVTITVDFDDQEVPLGRPFFAVADGQHRTNATKEEKR